MLQLHCRESCIFCKIRWLIAETPKACYREISPRVRELASCEFPDRRLKARLGKLMTDLGRKIGTTLPTACQDWAATKAAYRAVCYDIPHFCARVLAS